MFNKIQLTVFTLLVFACSVVIFPIHCDLSDNHTASKNKQSKYGKLYFIEHSREYLFT